MQIWREFAQNFALMFKLLWISATPVSFSLNFPLKMTNTVERSLKNKP